MHREGEPAPRNQHRGGMQRGDLDGGYQVGIDERARGTVTGSKSSARHKPR